MARPRTPTAQLEARGAFRKNPDRRRPGEPEVTTPVGNPPEHFDEIQVKHWFEIASLAPVGVLTSADRLDVEICAVLLTDFRAGEKLNFNVIKQLHTMLGKFGMNPSDRAKLSIEKPKETNPFEDL